MYPSSFLALNPVVERSDPSFDGLVARLQSALASRMRAIVTIDVTKALALTSPAYDDGTTEAQIRQYGRRAFASFSPANGSRSDDRSVDRAKPRQ